MNRFFHVVFLAFFIFYSLIFPVQAYANAALAATSVANAVGKTLISKMNRMGFAANDPRFGATISSATVTLTDVAATAAGAGGSAALGAIGAPVWLTLAASLAVGYGVQLALEYWIPNLPAPVSTGSQNPSMQVTAGTGLPVLSYSTTVTNPNPDTVPRGLIYNPDLFYGFYGATGFPSIQAGVDYLNGLPKSSVNYVMVNVVIGVTWYSVVSGGISVSTLIQYDQVTCRSDVIQDVKPNCTGDVQHGLSMTVGHGLSAATCPSGTSWNNTSYACMPPATITTTESKSGTAQDLANGVFTINDGINGSPLNPELIAKLADYAWQQAANAPGYAGIPYQQYQPVTAWDVANAYSPESNPNGDPYPTVGDALAPMAPPNTAVSINLEPNAIPSTSTTANPVDLGPDPGIAAPGLEATPTASQILSPLLNLMPDLKSFVVPSHAATCPRPSASVWGQTLTLSGHCDLLDDPAIHDSLYAVMALVWTMVGLFIVLRA